jgi:hypothetical protein
LNLRIQQLSSSNCAGNNSFAQTGIDRFVDLYVCGPAGAASAAAPVLNQLQQMQSAAFARPQMGTGLIIFENEDNF